MTTLVWKYPYLASDSQANADNGNITFSNKSKKIFKIGRKFFSGAGTWDCIGLFVHSYKKNKRYTHKILDMETLVLEIGKKNILVHTSSGIQTYDKKGFYAWGSGRSSALAALYMGASAEQAVEIACKVDNFSGGKVTSVRIG